VPGELAGALVQLGQMHHGKRADPRQNPTRAPQHQVGPPDIGPATGKDHTAGHRLRPGKARLEGLGGQGGFKPGRGLQEYLERVGHGAS